MRLTSTNVWICAQEHYLTSAIDDTLRKSLTVGASQVSELLHQDDVASFGNIEEAKTALVLEVYQSLIFASYVQPFLSEEQKKIQAVQAAFKQRAAEVATKREEKKLKAEAEREAQEREKLRISKLVEDYQEEARREKEIENYICQQIDGQVSDVSASLDGSVIQNVTICITDVTGILKLELHIPSEMFDDMLSNCRYHLKGCQSMWAIQDKSCLSRDWLNQLRHECTNYDAITARLKKENRHSESTHNLVRFAINSLINIVWIRLVIILLAVELSEAKATVLQLEEGREARRQEKIYTELAKKAEAEQVRIEVERVQAEAQNRKRLEEQKIRSEWAEKQSQQVYANKQEQPIEVHLNPIETERLRVEAERTRLNIEDTERSRANLARIRIESENRSNPERQKENRCQQQNCEEQVDRQHKVPEALLHQEKGLRTENEQRRGAAPEQTEKQCQQEYAGEQLARQKKVLDELNGRRRLIEEKDLKVWDNRKIQDSQDKLNQEKRLQPSVATSGGGCILLVAGCAGVILVSKLAILLFQSVALFLLKVF